MSNNNNSDWIDELLAQIGVDTWHPAPGVCKAQLRGMVEAKSQILQKLNEAEAIHIKNYRWLLGYSDFPQSEPGKRYNWRPELRKRIPPDMLAKLKAGGDRDA